MILEDDGMADIATSAPRSLGAIFPDRVLHIRSLSKTLGPDLRLAVLSGPAKLLEQIQSYRSFGAGWTGRILQSAAAWLLNDAETLDRIAQARAIYLMRRRKLLTALAEHGMVLPDGEGFCLWVPVQSEQFALVTLAARGMAVQPGSKFSVKPIHYLRVATSTLEDRYEEVAEAVAIAALGHGGGEV